MREPSEQQEHEARVEGNERRSRELEKDSERLHSHLIDTAESVRRSHEQVADVMERLAKAGSAENAMRRRQMAERSRGFAEEEARQIAELKHRKPAKRNDAGAGDDKRS